MEIATEEARQQLPQGHCGECGRGRAVPRGRTVQIESQKFVYSSKHTKIKEQRQLDKDRNTSNDSNRRHVRSKGEGAGEIINGV